jgi:PEP-CTERM motif
VRTFFVAMLVNVAGIAMAPLMADTYTFTIDKCPGTNGCGVGSGIGTITTQQDGANTVEITVSLGGLDFSNSAFHGDNFLFNIAGTPAISISSVTPGWELVSTTAGSLGGDGWSFDYALTCDFNQGGACHGTGHTAPGTLTFDVTAPGLIPWDFWTPRDYTSPDFAADVFSNSTGNGGLIGATYTSGVGVPPQVPEPASVVLLGTVMLLAVQAARRRVA